VRFIFEGFLSAKAVERRARLAELKDETRTVIYHEAPHKLKATLSDMSDIFGKERRIALCRELTKLNEEIFRTTLEGAVDFYSENEPRGEYVLVVGGAEKPCGEAFWTEMDEKAHVLHYIELGMSKNDAIKAAARDRGVHKNEVYKKLAND
jgi:16S rRNA (cytidine1402-2'-O)-methyltransferase